jgi:glycine/D-amino acid oxidase-like deaminating enzyme
MSDTLACDVLVLGAGIAGAGAAFYLGSQGVDAILVEREHPASGPTGASSAICHLWYLEPELSQLARRGCQILKDLPELIGAPRVFHETGVLWVVGENNVEDWKETVVRIRDVEGGGLDSLTVEEVAKLAPNFQLDGIAMGVWEERHGYVDPYDAANELVRGAREKGVRFLGNRTAKALNVTGGKIEGVELSDGTKVSTERVVMATGPWTKSLVSQIGVELPLHIERHFMAVMDAPGKARDILPFCWVDDTRSHYARPEGENTILIGTWSGGGTGIRSVESHEEQAIHSHRVEVAGEFDSTVSTEEAIWTLEHMASRCPDIADLGIRPGYACMYDMSPDDMPVIDQIPGAEGLFVAAGSSGHGFKLGPAVGESLAKWALGDRSELLAPFSLARFG